MSNDRTCAGFEAADQGLSRRRKDAVRFDIAAPIAQALPGARVLLRFELPVLRRLLLRQAMLCALRLENTLFPLAPRLDLLTPIAEPNSNVCRQLDLRLRRLLQRELADRDVRLLGRLLSVLPA